MEHTPVATRAAKKINERFIGRNVDATKEIAQIIDDETGLRKLLEAAEEVAEILDEYLSASGPHYPSFQPMSACRKLLLRSIARVETP